MSEQATYTEHVYHEYSCGDMCEPIYQREEIVRCRDCTVYDGEGYGCSYGRGDDPDGFCAWGEKVVS